MSKFETQEFWDQTFEDGKDFRPMNLVLFDRLLKHLGQDENNKPKRAVDLGCGTGDFCFLLAGRGFDTIGLDISEVGLSKARAKSAQHQDLEGKIEFEQLDFNNIDGVRIAHRADLIFMTLTLAFIKDRKRFLDKVNESLAPGGRFVLMTPVLVNGYEHTDFMKDISIPLEELEEQLSSSFKTVEAFNCSYDGQAWVDMTYVLSK